MKLAPKKVRMNTNAQANSSNTSTDTSRSQRKKDTTSELAKNLDQTRHFIIKLLQVDMQMK